MRRPDKTQYSSSWSNLLLFLRLVQVALTTKLTTYGLDVLRRPWTIRRQEVRIRGQFRQPWTILDSAPRAPKPQGAGAIPVPPASLIPEFI
jgi:hypothetical protein